MKSSIGYFVHNNENIALSLETALDQGFNYIVTPLSHPRISEFSPISDVFLDSQERALIMVYIPSREYTRKSNVQMLKKELDYAVHFGVTNIVIESPFSEESQKILAEIVANFLKKQCVFVYLRLPLLLGNSTYRSYFEGSCDIQGKDYDETWRIWNRFRMSVGNHSYLKLALELNDDLPDDEHRVNRWLGESIGLLILKTNVFLTNASKCPTLSRPYQNFIQHFIFTTASKLSIVIRGNKLHEHFEDYVAYIKHLFNKDNVWKQSVGDRCDGFEDVLQIPLQPLQDNLQSAFYEIFETDEIKYQQYSEAMKQAFADFKGDRFVAMVLGAGRGPLVDKALEAAQSVGKYVNLYALDKNPNAVVTLKSLRRLLWGGDDGLEHGKVTIVNEDMRRWNPPEKADFVISELLGSFGDNELSPECLDGVWRYVHSNTVSIPQSYTSYIAPVQSQTLYSAMRTTATNEYQLKNPDEYGFVVHVRNAYLIDRPKAVFTFDHTDLTVPAEQRDNSREKNLTFRSAVESACHGFVGYFRCTLYKEVVISTEPSTANANMLSWFPIYFPIEKPFSIEANGEIELFIARRCDERKVWYEWQVRRPEPSKVHNLDGKVYAIGLNIAEE